MSKNVHHSNENDSWLTPIPILGMAREVLGEIDLDPASTTQANERVKAKSIITREEDGLLRSWLLPRESNSTIWINPPGSKRDNKSMAGLFWSRLMRERDLGLVGHAIYLCFSLNVLQVSQNYSSLSCLRFPICVPRSRIAYDHPSGLKKVSPSHPSALVYVPGNVDKTDIFRKVFSKLGAVKV